jgi:hypothetical protein
MPDTPTTATKVYLCTACAVPVAIGADAALPPVSGPVLCRRCATRGPLPPPLKPPPPPHLAELQALAGQLVDVRFQWSGADPDGPLGFVMINRARVSHIAGRTWTVEKPTGFTESVRFGSGSSAFGYFTPEEVERVKPARGKLLASLFIRVTAR